MAERYTRVFTQQGQFYCPDAPVIIEAGALLKDNQTGKIIAQIKFESVSSDTIIALTVRIRAQDVSGQSVEGVEGFQYLDLSVNRGETFGQKIAIPMPNSTTRMFACECTSVVFANGYTWRSKNETQWLALPAKVKLDDRLGCDLADQYRRDTMMIASFVPTEYDGFWHCACGTLNRSAEAACHTCGWEKARLLAAFDLEALQSNQIKHEQMVAEKKALEADREKKKQTKLKKVIVSVLVAIIILVSAAFVGTQVIAPALQYKHAEELLAQGCYDEAIATFKALGDYSDSASRIADVETARKEADLAARYAEAEKLLEQGKYDEAIKAFRVLGDYSDSTTRLAEAMDGKYAPAYAAAEELFAQGKYDEAIVAFKALGDYFDSVDRVAEAIALKNAVAYAVAEELLAQGKYDEAIAAFKALGNYSDSATRAKAVAYFLAEQLYNEGELAKAALAFAAVGDYQDAKQRCQEYWAAITMRDTICTSISLTLGLKSNGTVVAVGKNDNGQCNVQGWTDIIAISAGTDHAAALKSDGTVVAVGNNEHGQCDVQNWIDIVAISAGECYTVGLKSNGTVVAVGKATDGQCDVEGWTDIIAISAGIYHTVGLKSDGTVVAVGKNDNGQCNVQGWTDIIAISTAHFHTMGLKSDGTVVTTGSSRFYNECNIQDWTDIVAVYTSTFHTVGLKSDGTVVAVGGNADGQCDARNWKNIKIPE